jgi:hypothetical protein
MNKHDKRDRSGRYATGHICDGCGKPTGADYCTDADVCGAGDGPGFFVCERKACMARLELLDVEARRRLYTDMRARIESSGHNQW